jgi:NTE family protein/lysophospholipid hydrolase
MNDAQVHEVLRQSKLFGALPAPELNALVGQLRVQRVQAGSQLFAEGEAGQALYIVLQGRLRVSRHGRGGELLLYNELCPGEFTGVASLMLDQPRTADLVALRDAIVAELRPDGYEHLLRLNPLVFSRLFAQALHHYLRHIQQLDEGQRAQSIAVVPLQAGPEAVHLARDLHAALAAQGACALLEPRGEASNELDVAQAMLRIDQHDRQAEVLLIRAEPAANAWTRLALRQADQILFVATPGTSPLPGPLERRLREEAGFDFKRQHLAVVYPAETLRPAPIRPWRQDRPRLERVLPLRRHHADDVGRLARLLTGRAVGLVLGGGGARGFAHLGVLRALREAGIPIDLVGGNSMGALIGSQWALGHDLAEIQSRILSFVAQGERPTLPVVSLLSGRRMEQGLRRLCDNAQVDGLWTPFFTAACNLSRAATTVLEHGPLWRAVLASNSPAGLLPPVLYDGELLVDGAILDNVPVEAMRQRLGTPLERRRGNGTVIAIDVDVQEPLEAPAEKTHLRPMDKLRSSLGRGQSLPGIGDILYRAGHLGGLMQRQKTVSLSDFYLEPPVADFSLMAYKRAPEIVERGYEHAVKAIAAWDLRPFAKR